MPPQAARNARISIDDYLAGEREAGIRHEYIDGEVFAMTGASRGRARRRRCQSLTNNKKLAGTRWQPVIYYPDLMLACNP